MCAKPVLPAADLAACRALLRGGSRSFHAAGKLLPARIHAPATALYAFCRIADDAIDEGGDAAALAALHARLDAAYAGRPHPEPADRAFAAVIAHYAIPRALPEALLDGFAWDQSGRRYETLPELEAYAARVAGSVGAMMALLMEERRPEVLARACDLGVAMQLSNIARDVGEDARSGRLYLPLAWMREAGLDPEAWLAAPAFDARLAGVVGRLLAAADGLYRRAEGGIACLPLACRPGIGAARVIYAEIGRAVERRGLDSVSHRATVSGRRKAVLLARSLGALMMPRRAVGAPPLEATRFLVEAAVAASPPRLRGRLPARSFDERVAWLVGLFTRLQQQELGRNG
ncbi:phytoene/squalene synthase family protein [Belnapia rosea]|uniref:phytoene/squalene synthase family protein n=1 Tax=Belnapia rosea TaxID=938405 RepID=UPI00088FE68D|nr:phytoene/squalene synthase family protein [Belnapia rosea]SDB71011.1 phytoene synthase [Belnapia rosea]